MTAAVKKDKKNSVLDTRKSYNICEWHCSPLILQSIMYTCIHNIIAILLAHLKLPPSQIKKALLAMDTSVLSEQHLQQMETFAPDKKEVCIDYV